jgi:hypothetical protein
MSGSSVYIANLSASTTKESLDKFMVSLVTGSLSLAGMGLDAAAGPQVTRKANKRADLNI